MKEHNKAMELTWIAGAIFADHLYVLQKDE